MILDTNILIDVLSGDEKLEQSLEKMNEKIATTVVTRYELQKGSGEADGMSLIGSLEVYGLEDRSADRAAAIYKQLEKKGKLVNEFDILIASIAIAHDELLVTRDNDFKEIAKVSPLKIIFV